MTDNMDKVHATDNLDNTDKAKKDQAKKDGAGVLVLNCLLGNNKH